MAKWDNLLLFKYLPRPGGRRHCGKRTVSGEEGSFINGASLVVDGDMSCN